jgi:hypothetical protein
MGLLAGAEHASESSGEEEEYDDLDDSIVNSSNGKTKAPLTREDKKAMALLIVLCTWLVSCCCFCCCWPLFALFVFFSLTIVLARWYCCPRFDPRCSCAYLYPVYVWRTCSPRHVV